MGKMSWTPEQQAAIETRNSNLLVAAAAGAGKTAVLVQRIIEMITVEQEPTDIDNLLIVTFTNAAATEMRERIAEAITKVLEENPDSARMHRQLTLLNKASITTIHSFCLEVIRNNFQQLDLDPGFRIADQTETVLLKLEVLQELFEDRYEDTSESKQEFFDLLESYGGNRDDQALQNMVLNLYDFIQSSPWPDRWLDQKTALFSTPAWEDLSASEWGKVLLNTALLELEGLQYMMDKAVEIIASDPGLDGYYPVFLDEKLRIEKLLALCRAEDSPALAQKDLINSSKWDTVYKALQSFDFAKLPRAGKDCDPEQRDYVKEIRDTVKKRIGDLQERVWPADSEEAWQDLQTLAPLVQCLCDLVKEFTARYSAKKSAKSLVDFNDLEHFCLEILSEQAEQGAQGERVPSKIACNYRERYAEILVDEYQDSNDVQETIIKMISREQTGKPNVFMVGDVKQSIYRFRQAKPELFQEKYDKYKTIKKEGSSESSNLEESVEHKTQNLYRKILLYKNFRSRQEVVDAVNFIFKQIMSKAVGELDYTAEEALNPGADYPSSEKASVVTGGEVELHLLQTTREDSNSPNESADSSGDEQETNTFPEEAEMLDNIQWEARLIASRIKELLQPDEAGQVFHVLDKESRKYRPAEYRDIVILLRTTRNWADVFVEEFALQGIPAFADTGSGFFKTVEVQVILSLLQVIDNPLQDIPLLAVLRSPLVSLTTDELAELRLAKREVLLFDALKALAKTGSGPAAQKARMFLGSLEKWRNMALYMSTDLLLWQLYQETGYLAAVGAMPAGQQRQANLRILFERARQFEGTSLKGLFNFIYFIDKLKSGQGDLGSAKMLGEKDNVVRIMSIHKSKGLEFPVVILGGCGKKFNLQDMNKNILLHHQLGFGPDVVDYRRRISYPSIPKLAIREKIRLETMSEEMRILYVALTRAKEKLIITGAVKDISKVYDKWSRTADTDQQKLPAYRTIKAENYLDWLGPAVLRHQAVGRLPERQGILSTPASLQKDPSCWRIRNWRKTELACADRQERQDEQDFFDWLKGLTAKTEVTDSKAEVPKSEISRRLSWEYPFSKLAGIPAKLTVTELKRRFEEIPEGSTALPQDILPLIKKPLFLEKKKGLSSAEKGTVMHFCMQHLDFGQEDIERQITHMVNRELLTEEQARVVEVQKIRDYLASPLGKRMLASPAVHREVPFNIEIPCQEVFEELDDECCQGETVLLQGVIDCCFEEPEGLVLVDYKTDYVPEEGEEVIKDRYRLQVSYYARALEKLTGKKVKEKYIYLFFNGKALEYLVK